MTYTEFLKKNGCILSSSSFNNDATNHVNARVFIVSEENCDRVVRSGLMQYALDVFEIKSNSTNKTIPKILSAALDTLVHISNTSTG